MRALSASELLQVWEQGLAQPPARQALMLLAAACSEMSTTALAQLSIGQRNGLLLALRAWLFGPQLVGLVKCPACSDPLQLTFDAADVCVAPSLQLPSQHEGLEVYALSIAGYAVRYRLPNTLDIEAIAGDEDEATARAELFRRCLLSAARDGEPISAEHLPDNVVSAVGDHMAQIDPQADVQLALTCPACTYQWPAIFDIVSFFWSEIDAWAVRLLSEVHTLASAYGWRESDILAMTPWRRQRYLELIGGPH